ncbi:hypothetical protein V6N12_040507 [Hibiscus sabdariffa]|uniref:Uncharacterized protein n=1 Tax=Hibiscus sabdariffa TaxID=183260 RepID=A0ABR2E7H9_9ROSI
MKLRMELFSNAHQRNRTLKRVRTVPTMPRRRLYKQAERRGKRTPKIGRKTRETNTRQNMKDMGVGE